MKFWRVGCVCPAFRGTWFRGRMAVPLGNILGMDDLSCARCGSSVESVDCGECGGEGMIGHDCGDDTCCCLYPLLNVTCDTCEGKGHWIMCLSTPEFCRANPLPNCEAVTRSTPTG